MEGLDLLVGWAIVVSLEAGEVVVVAWEGLGAGFSGAVILVLVELVRWIDEALGTLADG